MRAWLAAAVRHVGGAAQQVDRLHRLAMQAAAALFHAVEIQNVVHQPDQPVAVADRHFHHLPLLLRPLVQRARLNQSQRCAQRSQRRAQLVAHRGNELVLHAFQAPPLETSWKATTMPEMLPSSISGLALYSTGNRACRPAPEDLVPHADRFAAPQRLQNRAGRFE
jgi:hypothetical protein